MSIRKRTWKTESGEERFAYIVQYSTAEKDARGKRRRHIKTFDRKKDAEDFQAQVRVDLKKGTHTPASKSITVEAAGELWIDGCGDLERSTVDQYRQHLDYHINPYLGGLKLSALTVAIARDWQDKLRNGAPAPGHGAAEPRSAAMVKKVTTSLSSLLSDAMERGKVGHNVVRSMTANRRRKRKVERRQKRKLVIGRDIPEPGEIDALLLHTTSDRWRAFFLTAVRCGLRASELRGLHWQDIDFKKSELHVRQRADRYNAIGNPKSADSQRVVPIPPKTLVALREWKAQCPKLDGRQHFVFPNGSGNVETHSNIIERGLIPAWEAAGVTVPVLDADGKPTHDKDGRAIVKAKYTGAHSLRHHFASWCLARPPIGLGLNLKELSERIGHASIQITIDTYAHLIPRADHAEELAAAEGKFG
ncbi:tyrosine-type recombinase/integrase [Bradyrhizobium sp. CB82]|uniref:tyrosine-type recombinase/integrase n=1 Tax=Bradyrhizobium sp. CB82 TaxID=3039159 RepID=UPI0024B21A52|nr:tyrosine-type recombinase/integrase [Bradyrhizobium sp. CB82]WFU37315.1 tyrosine-type recombinase/integrase [Bradyrhizobium sp. CB82]